MRSRIKLFPVEGTADIKQTFSGDEISLKELFLIFWARKYVFALFGAVMFCLAIIQIATTPKYYSSTSSYITEESSSGLSVTNNGFAQLLGFSEGGTIGSGSGSFSDPAFFPTILASQSFLADLIDESFYFNIYGKEMTLKDFVLQNDERSIIKKWLAPVLGLPSRFIRFFEKDAPSIEIGTDRISSEENEAEELGLKPVSPILNLEEADLVAMELLKSRIEVSSLGNIIVISTTMPDPLVCAQLNQMVSTRLLDFVIKNETEKERRDLGYLRRRVSSAKNNFEVAQEKLAMFRDQNQGVVSAAARTQEQRLQSEYNILFGLYQQLATDLEKKKVALEEKTPVFTVFEPVYVPVRAEGGASFKTVLVYIILGFFLGGFWVSVVIAKTLLTGDGKEK